MNTVTENNEIEVIKVTAPIALDIIKRYFTNRSLKFVVDYENSSLKGLKLLVYLSNMDLPVDIEFDPTSTDGHQLIKEYLNASFMVDIPSLEMVVMNQLMEQKTANSNTSHALPNATELNEWVAILDSLLLFNLNIVGDAFSSALNDFVVADKKDFAGVNFVQLLKYPEFYSFYESVDTQRMVTFPHFWNDYIFRGKNLFSFWATENNPIFLLTYGISEGLIDGPAILQAKIQSLKNVGALS